MALIEQEFQMYQGKAIRLRLTGLLSPIRLYLARLRSSSNTERNVWPYPVSRPGYSANSLAPPRGLSDIAFVTRRKRRGQMRGRRPGKTGGVFAGIH
jgi:hypothetical protein